MSQSTSWRAIRAGLSIHPDLGVLAQRGGELLLQDDAAAHPPRCLPLGCRPAGGDQCLSYPTKCQPQTLRLDEIRRGHSGQARPLPCTIRLSHCTSSGQERPVLRRRAERILSALQQVKKFWTAVWRRLSLLAPPPSI